MPGSAKATVGKRTCHTERRVSGPSPYGGEWDHGWARQTAEAARAHAAEMASHHNIPWARVQTRLVETEITDEEIVHGD